MSGTVSGLFFPSCALVFSILLCIVYFSKKKLEINENRLYIIMLVSILLDNICTLFLQIIANSGINEIEIFGYILNKLDFICLITYAISLLVYVLIITVDNIQKNYNVAFKYGSIIYLLIALIIVISPLKLMQDGDYRGISGLASIITFSITAVCIALSFFVTVINFKKINKKHLPVLIMPLIVTAILVLYVINPYLVIISILLTLMNYIMYFTIENPDLKIIKELSEAKKKAEKYVNEKEIFSFNMSQKIKDPILDIDEICKELKNSNDVEELKEGIKDIELSSAKIMYLVSDTLSGVSANKVDIVEDEYNVSNLFALVNQYIKNKSRKYSVDFYESKYNKDTIVVGDNLKIKEVVCAFALGLMKKISNQSMALNTTTYGKKENVMVSFRYIIPQINLTLEELNSDEEITKYEEIDFEKVSLSTIKKIINLLDGYIEVKNIEDKKLEIIINFEQKKAIIQNKDSLKYLNDYENQNKEKPRIIFVDDDEKEKVSKYINHFKYDVIIAKNGEECLNMIRSGEKANLIILDDDLDKLDTMTVLNKLQAIDGFNIPVIYMATLSIYEKEKDLIAKGFAGVLQKPLKQTEVDEIIDKYIK